MSHRLNRFLELMDTLGAALDWLGETLLGRRHR